MSRPSQRSNRFHYFLAGAFTVALVFPVLFHQAFFGTDYFATEFTHEHVGHHLDPSAKEIETDRVLHGENPYLTSRVPPHCRPWPGRDDVVEGGDFGYHFLLNLEQTSTKAKIAAPPQPATNLTCVVDYPSHFHHGSGDKKFDADDLLLASTYLSYFTSHCQQLHIFTHGRNNTDTAGMRKMLVDAIDDKHPHSNAHVWSSAELSVFRDTIFDRERHRWDWMLILPAEVYVIFDSLRSELSELQSASKDNDKVKTEIRSVIAGVMTNLNEKMVGAAKPNGQEELRSGHLYDWEAIKNDFGRDKFLEVLSESAGELSMSPIAKKLSTHLSLSSSYTQDEQPSTTSYVMVDISNYKTSQHWLRLYSIFQPDGGACKEHWTSSIQMGARDENGKWGYVLDETLLRRRYFSHHNQDQHVDTDSTNALRDNDNVGTQSPWHNFTRPWHNSTRKALRKIKISPNHTSYQKVLCMVYTHSNRHHRLKSITTTWAPHCDGFFAASNLTDPEIGAVNLWHQGEEEYDNMWLKIRSMFEYAFMHYKDKYDFFHMGGDDYFLIPENLRWAAVTGNAHGPYDLTKPLFLGGAYAVNGRHRFCGGGSGYTLNRIALDILLTDLWYTSACTPQWRTSMEDVCISRCFRAIDLQCMDTNDALDEARYHQWDAAFHSEWRHEHLGNWGPKNLLRQGIVTKDGMGQISETSVAFHLKQFMPKGVKPNPDLPEDGGMRFYYSLLYGTEGESNK